MTIQGVAEGVDCSFQIAYETDSRPTCVASQIE